MNRSAFRVKTKIIGHLKIAQTLQLVCARLDTHWQISLSLIAVSVPLASTSQLRATRHASDALPAATHLLDQLRARCVLRTQIRRLGAMNGKIACATRASLE